MKSSLLLLLALVGGAHAIPTMLKEDVEESTRRRAASVINHRILAVAGSGSGSGSGSAGPKPDDFDPKSPLTSSLPLPGRSLSLPSPTPPSSPDHGTRQHSCVHINN